MSQQDPALQDPSTPAPEPVAPGPVAPSYDAATIAAMEQRYNEAQGFYRTIEPIREDVEWMLQDPQRLEGIRRYRKSYEEASKPQILPELQPVVSMFEDRFKRVDDYITRQETAEQNRIASERQSFERTNMEYAARLQAEAKLSRDDLLDIGAYADAMANRLGRNVGLEEAYKKMRAFGGEREKAPAAPSLRAEAGAPGVPGPSKTDDMASWNADFHGQLVKRIAAARQRAS